MRDLHPEKAATRTYLILLAITLISIMIVFLLPLISQWPSYHQFVDRRQIWGIPNFWNVISNLLFFW